MLKRPTILAAVVAALGVAAAFPLGARAQDACSSAVTQRQCSLDCCGRLDCTPGCQAYCVRACIEACRDPGKRASYQNQLPGMKNRCGYVIAPSRVVPK
jgi:hypothetical protein